MPFAPARSASAPLSEINTTPLIDVLLVLLIVFVMSIPMATHSVEVPLPSEIQPPVKPNPVRNKVVMDSVRGFGSDLHAVLLGRKADAKVAPAR